MLRSHDGGLLNADRVRIPDLFAMRVSGCKIDEVQHSLIFERIELLCSGGSQLNLARL